jgi:hypothetical protein
VLATLKFLLKERVGFSEAPAAGLILKISYEPFIIKEVAPPYPFLELLPLEI